MFGKRERTLLKLAFSMLFLINVACADSSSPVTEQNTVSQTKYKVETVATNLEVPWSIAFALDGRMFFTERPGRLRVMRDGKLQAAPFFTIPDIEPSGESGLMGMTLHPNFAENHLMYLAYAYRVDDNQRVKVVRYRETGETLVEPKIIIENIPASRFHSGTRLLFGADGKLYITTGDATNQSQAQELDKIGGKTLRLNEDGTIPADNPFLNQEGARPEIWTYGHRNSQGMAWQPETGLMFQTEHGPSLIDGVSLFKRSGGDEVNIVERGKNYGWAKISHNMTREGMETPIVQYSPAVAPASAMFYSGNLFPEWKGNFFFGALKGESLIRLVISGRNVVSQEKMFKETYGRIREVAQAPDGSIYFSTSNRDGRGNPTAEDDQIMRIVPIGN